MLQKPSIIYLLIFLLTLGGCGSQRKVKRIDPGSRTDLSGRWNDTDSRLVSEKMISDALKKPWRVRFEERNDRKPVIIVGLIKNKTHEHIEPEVFIKDIEKEFINSNLVRVVQAGEFREKLREERADQHKYASMETQARWGKELGADFMMTGILTSIVDEYKKEKTVTYQVNLELSDLETNEKVWIGEKEIKKYIKN